MIAVDTNVLVRLLINDPDSQTQARRLGYAIAVTQHIEAINVELRYR